MTFNFQNQIVPAIVFEDRFQILVGYDLCVCREFYSTSAQFHCCNIHYIQRYREIFPCPQSKGICCLYFVRDKQIVSWIAQIYFSTVSKAAPLNI